MGKKRNLIISWSEIYAFDSKHDFRIFWMYRMLIDSAVVVDIAAAFFPSFTTQTNVIFNSRLCIKLPFPLCVRLFLVQINSGRSSSSSAEKQQKRIFILIISANECFLKPRPQNNWFAIANLIYYSQFL